jgi:hypothetical protein
MKQIMTLTEDTMKTMIQTDLKLPAPAMTNSYGSSIMTSQQQSSLRNCPRSPTFQKAEMCIKSITLSDDDPHIFGTSPNSFTLNQSFEEIADQSMNVSISSSTCSWPMSVEKVYSSFGSIGLPSEYPSAHRKNTSLTSTTLEDLDDFDEFFDDISFKKVVNTSYSTIGQNAQKHPLKTDGSVLKTKPQSKSRHKRHRTEIASSQNYREVVAESNQQRRRRNHALCAKDFHEHILKELFADVSPDAFCY